MIQISKKIRLIVVAALVLVLATSCDPAKKYEEEQEAEIQNYIVTHPDLNFVLKPSGLYYCDVTVGTGIAAATHDTAYVMYTGKLLDDEEFITNIDGDTLIFPIGEGGVPEGFFEGITYMNEGGSAVFLMPSDLGYGNSGYVMQAYTPLLFEVYLPKIVVTPGK